MADMPTLDLDAPGTLWVATANQETNTFHIVLPKDKYTSDALNANPTVDPGDQLISPWSASWKDAQATGVTSLDLAASGKVQEIKNKLDQLYQAGQDPPTTVKAIVIATAKDGNKLPDRVLTNVIDMNLVHAHELRLAGNRTYVTAGQWQAGTRDFLVQITTKGISQIQLSTSVGNANIWPDSGAPRGTTITIPASDAAPVTVHVDVLFTQSTDYQYIGHAQITYSWDYWKPAWTERQMRTVFSGKTFTLTATGTGGGGSVTKSIQLQAEAWAAMSGWMTDPAVKAPPNVYYHPHT
jgi:hypothetical protein